MPVKLDPRVKALVKKSSVNRRLYTQAIQHSVYLERYKKGVVRKVVDLLRKDVIKDLNENLARRLANVASRGIGESIATNQRLKDLIISSKTILQEGLSIVGESVVTELKDLALSEARWQQALVASTSPVELNFIMPNAQTLVSTVTSRPMQGRHLRDWFGDLAKQTQLDVTKQINLGIAQGETVQQMVKRVIGTSPSAFSDGAMGTMRRRAEGVVRTAVSHVTNHARMETYEQNDDIVDKWQYVATLDDVTCPICGPLDGQIYDMGDTKQMPPKHINCRCTSVPVVKSFEELGLPLEEIDAGTRSSLDGRVSETLTYEEWLQGKVETDYPMVQDILGKRRAELFRGGEFSISEFVDRSGKTVTLKELEKN